MSSSGIPCWFDGVRGGYYISDNYDIAQENFSEHVTLAAQKKLSPVLDMNVKQGKGVIWLFLR